MRRSTILVRIPLYIATYAIVLLIGWFALPTGPSPDEKSLQASFRAGHSITRVFQTESFYPYTDRELGEHDSWRWSTRNYIFTTFQLKDNAKSGKREVLMGTKALPIPEFEEGSLDPIDLSLPFKVSLRKGDTDGIILPWFNFGDAVPLYWWTSYEKAEYPVRTLHNPAKGRLEIWPDSSNWTWPFDEKHMPSQLQPFAVIQASSKADEPPTISFPGKADDSASPSPFYIVRLAIMALLAPVVLFVLFFTAWLLPILLSIASFLAQVGMFLIAAGVVYGLFVWMKNGRPDINIQETIAAVTEAVKEAAAKRRSRDDQPEEPSVLIDLEAEAHTSSSSSPTGEQHGNRRRSS